MGFLFFTVFSRSDSRISDLQEFYIRHNLADEFYLTRITAYIEFGSRIVFFESVKDALKVHAVGDKDRDILVCQLKNVILHSLKFGI